MDRYVVGAGLFAIAAALWLGPLLSSARAQTAGFAQCAVMDVDVTTHPQQLDKRTVAIPPGWTPLGGGYAMVGSGVAMQTRGGIVICK